MAAHQGTTYGEGAEAAVRAIFGLTAAVGTMAAAMAAVTGQLPLIALPTLVLLGWLVVGAPVAGAAYAGAAVWLVLAPTAQGEALLAPLAMVVLCIAIALGPERVLAWLSRDAAPAVDSVGDDHGWIEDEPHRIG
ncbi:MAG: hypothetical protein ACRDGB_08235 [Candidatus Limnocylindria bacterium]